MHFIVFSGKSTSYDLNTDILSTRKSPQSKVEMEDLAQSIDILMIKHFYRRIFSLS